MSYLDNTPQEVSSDDRAAIAAVIERISGASAWNSWLDPYGATNMARLLRAIRDDVGAADDRYRHARNVAAVQVSGWLIEVDGRVDVSMAPHVVDAMVDRVTRPVETLWSDETLWPVEDDPVEEL